VTKLLPLWQLHPLHPGLPRPLSPPTCSCCTVLDLMLCGSIHFRVRCAMSRNVSRSKARGPSPAVSVNLAGCTIRCPLMGSFNDTTLLPITMSSSSSLTPSLSAANPLLLWPFTQQQQLLLLTAGSGPAGCCCCCCCCCCCFRVLLLLVWPCMCDRTRRTAAASGSGGLHQRLQDTAAASHTNSQAQQPPLASHTRHCWPCGLQKYVYIYTYAYTHIHVHTCMHTHTYTVVVHIWNTYRLRQSPCSNSKSTAATPAVPSMHHEAHTVHYERR